MELGMSVPASAELPESWEEAWEAVPSTPPGPAGYSQWALLLARPLLGPLSWLWPLGQDLAFFLLLTTRIHPDGTFCGFSCSR